MNKKEKIFKSIIGIMISISIGAGAMYLANYKKLDFMNRYPELLDADEFVKETLLIDVPKDPDKKTTAEAYFKLYGDKYTFVEGKEDTDTIEYARDKVNNSATAKKSGFRVQFNESGQPYFSAVVEGLPADKQGVRVGDIIKNVDDFEVTEYKHAVRLIGKDQEVAKLIIERDGKEISMDFVRSSDDSEMIGITSKMYGDVLYVKIDSVSYEILEPFEKAVSENSFNSIIIDLRGNGGGYTDAAIKIADKFIGKSQTVLQTQSGVDEIYETNDEIMYDVPIAVLINENTASAAEILTALLKQYGDATLVGMNTFGKGIYQNKGIFYGNSVRYTEGYYTVGDWENYQGKGIKPDVVIDMDSDYIGTDKDIQLEKTLELVK
ncbi:MAG: hypothetical protein IJB68_03265 [Ruminococcus sp.]|nr:hypothetical protein [Ruminococcus sp.]